MTSKLQEVENTRQFSGDVPDVQEHLLLQGGKNRGHPAARAEVGGEDIHDANDTSGHRGGDKVLQDVWVETTTPEPSGGCGGGCETYMLYERNLAKRVEGS